jgi:hypothetical protein
MQKANGGDPEIYSGAPGDRNRDDLDDVSRKRERNMTHKV